MAGLKRMKGPIKRGRSFRRIINSKVRGRAFLITGDANSLDEFISAIRSYLDGTQVRGETLSLTSTGKRALPSDAGRDVPSLNSIYSGVRRLELIVRRLLLHCSELIAVVESNHIDSVYRNALYHWYSRRMSNTPRFTLRVSFFKRDGLDIEAAEEVIYSSGDDEAHYRRLKENFRGSVVIYPLGGGLLGRTIISPSDLVDETVHVRLSEFELKVFGRKLTVDAFPFRMQDAEVMSCAEVTLINMLEYFSSRYQEYSMALPNDLIELEEAHSSERAIPARGINYMSFSQLLSHLGFYPRLLSLYSLQRTPIGLPGEIQFRRYLYWYLGSGIPAAVNVAPPSRELKGHSLAVVGFTDSDKEVVETVKGHFLADKDSTQLDKTQDDDVFGQARGTIARMEQSGRLLSRICEDGDVSTCRIFQEADFPRRLVTVDEAQIPYQICEYERLSSDDLFSCENMVFPLHRGMALDAQDAYEMFMMIFEDERLGALSWGSPSIGDDEPIIMRMFLVTAGSYRGFRARTTPPPLRYLFETQVLPHFIWVAELVHMSDYTPDPSDLRSFAEIVLDATTGRKTSFEEKLLLMRYPGRMAWREPYDSEESFGIHSVTWKPNDSIEEQPSLFRSYPFALRHIEPRYD